MDHAKQLAKYLAGERVELGPVMRSLPANIDRELAANVVVQLLERTYWLSKMCKKLPAPVIRTLLARDAVLPAHVFLRLAVPLDAKDAAVAAAWSRGVTALADLDTTYAWGSKQRRAKIRGIAEDAPMLQAVQATVAHAKDPSADMLAVLVADGSDASYDALVAHIDAAFASNDRRIDLLSRLRKHATKTPALDALFAEIDTALDERNATSPALALGPIIGIGEVELLWFDVWVSSVRVTSNRVPWIQGSIGVDSRSPGWFHASISTVEPTGIGSSTSFAVGREKVFDTLKLGTCEARDLPRWLATCAVKLDIAWNPFGPRTHLRGNKRTQLIRWLTSA